MRLRDHYDWVALGDHPGALLSASLVARLGQSVLVLSMGQRALGRSSEKGQFLDPEPNFVPTLGKYDKGTGLFLALLEKMGVLPAELIKIRPECSLPQIGTPGLNVVFARENSIWNRELQREVGQTQNEKLGLSKILEKSEQLLIEYWGHLPERLTLSQVKPAKNESLLKLQKINPQQIRNSIRKSLGSVSANEEAWLGSGQKLSGLVGIDALSDIKSFGEAMSYAVTMTDPSDPIASDLIDLLVLCRTGAAYQGGMQAVRELQLRMARRLGAHVPDGVECGRIFCEDGRLVGVQALSHGNMITVGGGVLGIALDHALPLVTYSGKKHPLIKSSPNPSGWRYTMALTVHAEAIPPGFGSRFIWKEPEAPVFEVEISDPADFGVSDVNNSLVFIRTVLPYTNESLDPAYLRMISARMFRQLTDLVPFLEFHLVNVFPDFRSSGDAEFKEAVPYEKVGEIPENLRSIDNLGVGSRSGIEGLYLATGESYPKLGMFGAMIAGVESASWSAHRAGIAGPLG